MASTYELFLSSSFSFLYPVKYQVKVKKCNYPITFMVSEQVTMKAVYKLYDRSPRRAGISTTDLSFNGCLNDEEKGVTKNSYFERIDTSRDVFSDDECINDAQVTSYSSRSLLDRRFVISVLSFCSREGYLELGRRYHAFIIKNGIGDDQFVGTSLVDMYAKRGDVDSAVILVNQMPFLDVASCNCLISGYANNGLFDEAFSFFVKLDSVGDGVDPNEYTYTIALASCASMKNLGCGRMFHAQVLKLGMALSDFVGTSIINMYTRLEKICDANKQLKEMGKMASNVSWNAQIAGLVHNEKAREAVEAFNEMVKNDAACDEFTYSIMLKACSLLPSLATCEQIHSRLVKTKFESNIHVGSSLIEAYNSCGTCRCHSNLQMAEFVAKKLLDLDPKDATVYVTLANMYAEAGKRLDAENQRKLMTLKKVAKEPGCSWIEVHNKIYRFFSRDKSHPEMPKVYEKLKQNTWP
ncbi:hypothetical protein Patl1_31295 [Pistacia atlantica]|uniref:Uncharacterized protein n=1 Tax=Pistacia atlantica TaxID=434234 RepID=A0ACC1A8P1_9ROSI|nr:hypothetical protein Patl1_31295 [Pistacia atlantica]